MLTINLEFDANAQAAPPSFRAGLEEAAKILEAAISDPITVNIGVGFNEFDGTPLTGDFSLGGIISSISVSYSALRAALADNETSATDTAAINALPNTLALNGQSNFFISTAQAKALGVLSPSASGIDGYVGFPSDFAGIGTGLISAGIVELIHAMGLLNAGGVLSLFEYTSPGVHFLSNSNNSTTPVYFSLDGGNTKLANYDVGFDSTLFLNVANDPLSIPNTAATTLTPLDLEEIAAIGFADSSSVSLETPNITPTTTSAGTSAAVSTQNVSVGENTAIPVLSLITSVSAPSSDAIAYYGFYDEGSGNGHFELNSVTEPDNQWIYVLDTQLNTLQYVGGSALGSETLLVDAFDYTTSTFTQTSQLTATTTPPPPITLGSGPQTVIGSAGETIIGGSGPDLINALAGPESIIGGSGATTVWGGVGDTIAGGSGNLLVDGTPGGETITGGSSGAIILGGAGDIITGSTGAGSSIIVGAQGDTVTGGTGSDLINGIVGGQKITGGSGSTTVWGGAGDTITGGSGTLLVDGTPGSQQIGGGPGASTILGGAGDTITGSTGSGSSIIIGAKGTTITGGSGSDLINGIAGSESITGGSGSTTVWGGAGDTITGGTGKLLVDGTLGGQTISGGPGSSIILGGAGDAITGSTGSGTSIVVGAKGDTVTGGTGSDLINGLAGGQKISGSSGSTTIWGGAGDTINGGSGTLLVAGQPGDTVSGGSGTGVILGSLGGQQISGSTGTGSYTVIGGGGDTVTAGSGADLINALAGSEVISGGTGHATVWGGAGDVITGGQGSLTVDIDNVNYPGAESIGDNGVRGADTIAGFSQAAGDRIFFPNDTTNAVNSVVGSAQTSGGNTLITLPDGTTMTLVGITNINNSFFT